jgi:predicted ribosome-associated RNA-binding protein Tma20
LFALRVFGDRPARVFCEAKPVAYGLWCACSKSKNKGIGVDSIHYLNDGLWAMEMA